MATGPGVEARTTLVDRFRAFAASDAPLYTWLDNGERVGPRLTRAETHTRACAVAGELRARGLQGQRVLLLFAPDLAFVPTLLGCFYAGVIAVPAWPPDPRRLARTLPRLQAVVADSAPALVLTSASLAAAAPLVAQLAPDLAKVPWVAVDDWTTPADPGPPPAPGDIALLQYTSGSTATPKGVVVRHHHLAANLDQLAAARGAGPHTRVVSWLPFYHDLGLVGGVLLAPFVGGEAVLFSPMDFLKQPLRWLRAVAEQRADTSAAPMFALELCARKLGAADVAGLDLSRWTMALVGAEPLRAAGIAAFERLLGPTGFPDTAIFQGYGLAEGVLASVCGDVRTRWRSVDLDAAALRGGHARPGHGASVVSVGRPMAGQRIEVVSTAGVPCAPGHVGEVWISGPNVCDGYWNRPAETEASFRARLPGDDATWLRTGDLGFVLDGELHIAGRAKDLLVVRGQNHHPQDIEATVEALAGVRPGGCVCFTGHDDQEVVVVAEVDPATDVDALGGAVRAAVARDHALAVAELVVVAPGTLPKTSSGKKQRAACRDDWRDGRIEALAVSRAPASAEDLLRRVLGEEFAGDRPFAELGVDSKAAVELAGDLERALGRPLPPTLLYDHPTPDALRRFLRGEAPTTPTPLRSRHADPIAVVGLGCRFPGAPSPDAFWALIREGVDAVREIGRFGRPGGFLDAIPTLDAELFGVAPREADRLDPQAALLLEVAWEALEHAGIRPDGLRGAPVGVFVGASSDEHLARQLQDPGRIDAWSLVGGLRSALAGRLAYRFGFEGPALVVDTACSSSLVAVHLAIRSLRDGESDLALAGGVSLMLGPEGTLALGALGALSPTGRCRAYGDGADGYVRAEGCGIVVLKRLADARASGDRILAVLRGSAVNQDGRSNGFSAPNGRAQVAVVRQALADAGIVPGDVGFVEGHGTGTALGDPIEVAALGEALAAERGGPLWIGSAKANIGHAEAAAGVAGLIKVVLAMGARVLPPSLHATTRSPAIRWDALGIDVVREGRPAPDLRFAGVSSFGLTGTNAHVIVEAPPEGAARAVPASGPLPFVVGAASEGALPAQAEALAAALRGRLAGVPLPAIASALVHTRAALPHRAVVVAEAHEELIAALDAVVAGQPHPAVATGSGDVGRGVVFVFPGQGAQWAGMGRALLAESADFRDAVDAYERVLAPLVGWSAGAVLAGEDGAPPLDRPDVLQVVQLGMMLGLAAVWRGFGVEPAAVVGHSLGEVAAACVAGAIDVAEAARIVVARTRALLPLDGTGGMLAVELGEADVAPLLGPGLTVAAVNGRQSIVVTGDRVAIDTLARDAAARGVSTRRIDVGYASHGPAIAAVRDPLLAAIGDVRHAPPRLRVVSTTTGRPHADFSAAHWYTSLREPVRFAAAVDQLVADGFRSFVEIGPHPVLAGPLADALDRAGVIGAVVGTLRRGEGGVEVAWRSAARIFATTGIRPALPVGPPVALPTYRFQHGPAVAAPASAPGDLDGIVRAEVAAVMGLPPERVPRDRPLRELGLDSAMAVELAARLGARFHRDLPRHLLFDHPTVAALAQALGRAPAPSPVPTAPRADEPIAVVGMACRLPGAPSPEALWALLDGGGSAIGPVPAGRWELGPWGASVPRFRGGFLPDVAHFDDTFFGISPREAEAMDPQQRLLLECSWEALERAGIAATALDGTEAGVWFGLSATDYAQLARPAHADGYLATGNSGAVASGRVAYHLGLRGPALTVDTACSSSLVAIHLATQALRRGECTLAFAGGATLMLHPGVLVEFDRLGGLAPDGLCKAFGAGADGTGFGEGVGVVVLERLSDARRLGHPVLAVIRGSATNQDGRSQGLTAPSGPAQVAVIHKALADAGLSPRDIDVVEAHGTGTRLGDPIEAAALAEVFADRAEALPVGALKSNVGHTQAAAGVAGLIKLILSLQHERLPATLHADPPADTIDPRRITLLRSSRPWPRGERPRRAGLSAFGFSGTNAHLVVEEAPPAVDPVGAHPLLPPPWTFPISAPRADRLPAHAAALRAFVEAEPDVDLAALALALTGGRAHHAHRVAIPASTVEELIVGLRAVEAEAEIPRPTSPLVAAWVDGAAAPPVTLPRAAAALARRLPLSPMRRHRRWLREEPAVVAAEGWRVTPLAGASAFVRPGRWLLLADGVLANRVERALEGRGLEVIRVDRVAPGARSEGWYALDPTDRAGVQAMLARAGDVRGIVCLWGVDAADPRRFEAIRLVDELLRDVPTPRTIVTLRGSGPDATPAGAATFGLASGFGRASPWTKVVDVGDLRAAAIVAALVDELLVATPDPVVRLRDGTRELFGAPAAPLPHVDPAAQETLAHRIRGEIARILHLPPVAIDLDEPVRALGLDSMSAMEVATRIRGQTGTRIPDEQFAARATCRTLAAWLQSHPSPPAAA